IGNYIALPTSVGRSAYVARYREHLGRAQARFAEFQALVPQLADSRSLQSDYLAVLENWSTLAEASLGHEGELDPMQYGELIVQYANLRAALHRISEQSLGSAMRVASAQLISDARAAR